LYTETLPERERPPPDYRRIADIGIKPCKSFLNTAFRFAFTFSEHDVKLAVILRMIAGSQNTAPHASYASYFYSHIFIPDRE
jgi:hypothetical protein